MDPLVALERLLLGLYSVDELRRFLRFGEEGRALVLELPEGPVSPAAFVHASVEQLARRGMLTSDFFERLVAERPGRVDEIRPLEGMLKAVRGPHVTGAESDPRKRRAQAYADLWAALEGAHLQSRFELLNKDALEGAIRAANAFLLRAAVDLSDTDRLLATSYLQALRRISSVLIELEDEAARAEWHRTGPTPPGVQALMDAWAEFNTVREQLVVAVRAGLAGA